MSDAPLIVLPDDLPPHVPTDLDILVVNVLRWGLLIASTLMMVGGMVHFWHFTGGRPHLDVFHSEPKQLRTIDGIVTLALHGDGLGLMQLSVLLLLATPFMRVAVAGYAFAREKDWKFVVISAIVFSVLMFGLCIGHSVE